MDIVLMLCFFFGVVYLGLEQAKVNAERRFASSLVGRGRSTLTATKWGVVLSVHPHK